MEDLIKLILGERFLAFTNFILIFCIVFHLICEFAHYIHEYASKKCSDRKLEKNNKLLKSLLGRISKLEKKIATCKKRKSDENI